MLGFQSLLFLPGNRPDRFAKALASAADVVCIDLEDAVPPANKEEARTAALAALGDSRLILRVNGLANEWGGADLAAIISAKVKPSHILVPMVDDAIGFRAATAHLAALGIGLIPLIETPKSLRLAHEIGAVEGVTALMFGGGDFSAALGVEMAWEPLRTARGQFLIAAAEAGVATIDVPWIRLDDPEGLAEECIRAQSLGFYAKAAIHPDQIAAIHQAFRPTDEELSVAREAEQAFAQAGGAAVKFKGQMLEAPIMTRYRHRLAIGKMRDA
jgi:(S)-citramalyl-CoA lyase